MVSKYTSEKTRTKAAIAKSDYDKQMKKDKLSRVKKIINQPQRIEKPFIDIHPNQDCSLNDVVKAADMLGLELHIVLSDKQDNKKTITKTKK